MRRMGMKVSLIICCIILGSYFLIGCAGGGTSRNLPFGQYKSTYYPSLTLREDETFYLEHEANAEDPKYYTNLDTIEENELYRIIQEELAAVLDEKKKKRKSKKKKKKKKKKAGTESGKESNLGDWFGRKGAPGKKGGWVDCNTCRKGKCKPCGRKKGEKRAKYPSCRPTPGACKERGRGKSWGKKSAKGKK